MIFSSYKFIFLFLPVVFIGYILLKKTKNDTARKLWLVISSLVFYSWGQVKFLPVFLFSLFSNYLFIKAIHTAKRKAVRIMFLVLGIAEGLSVLFYFKYFNFALSTVNTLAHTDFTLKNIILPLGISFYTFQIMTYLIDVFRKTATVSSLLDYLVYITFFPQLIVGPVVRHDEFLPQLEKDNFSKAKGDFPRALLLFSIGCAKKILVADPLIEFALTYYGTASANPIHAWFATIAYTLAYYFDFSGYGDMALGLGKAFGINLPFNFNSPYKARNMADFWRRWNISVSKFFDDYVFRNVFTFGDRKAKLVFATILTFTLSGLWHGAGWNYVLWGIANGILVSCVNILTLHRIKLPSIVAFPLTSISILLTRVLFDSQSLSEIVKTYRLMFSPIGEIFSQIPNFISDNFSHICLMALGCIICIFFKNTKEMCENFRPTLKTALWCALLLTLSLSRMGEVSRFLYFNF